MLVKILNYKLCSDVIPIWKKSSQMVRNPTYLLATKAEVVKIRRSGSRNRRVGFYGVPIV